MPNYDHISEKYGVFVVKDDVVRNSATGRLSVVNPARTDKHDMIHVLDDSVKSERNWHPSETTHI